VAAKLHLAEETFALHLLLQCPEGLVDIVVADENLHAGFLLDSRDPDMHMDISGADGNRGTNTARGDPFQRHNGVGRSNHQINNAKAKADIGAALARISEMLPNPPITAPGGERDGKQSGLDASCIRDGSKKFLVGIDAGPTALEHNRTSLVPLHYGCDRNCIWPLPIIGKNGSRLRRLSMAVRNASSGPNMTAGPDQNGIGRGLPNRQFALTALADIERLRVRIGTNPRNMYEPFDSASLRLRRDPLGRFDVDGMKRLSSPFEVKADCIHYAISISECIWN